MCCNATIKIKIKKCKHVVGTNVCVNNATMSNLPVLTDHRMLLVCDLPNVERTEAS